jgi:hypothetical protein
MTSIICSALCFVRDSTNPERRSHFITESQLPRCYRRRPAIRVRNHATPSCNATGLVLASRPGLTLPSAAGIRIVWSVALPNSDIAVMRLACINKISMSTSFITPILGLDVWSVGIPQSMMLVDPSTRNATIRFRALEGYVTYGVDNRVDVSFALPKGMSGAPLVFVHGKEEYVGGVLVGQSRVELVEDQFSEIVEEGKPTYQEKVARVDYTASAEILTPHEHFRAPQFGTQTLAELIRSEIAWGKSAPPSKQL